MKALVVALVVGLSVVGCGHHEPASSSRERSCATLLHDIEKKGGHTYTAQEWQANMRICMKWGVNKAIWHLR